MRFPGTMVIAVGLAFVALAWMSGAAFWLGLGVGFIGVGLVLVVRR